MVVVAVPGKEAPKPTLAHLERPLFHSFNTLPSHMSIAFAIGWWFLGRRYCERFLLLGWMATDNAWLATDQKGAVFKQDIERAIFCRVCES